MTTSPAEIMNVTEFFNRIRGAWPPTAVNLIRERDALIEAAARQEALEECARIAEKLFPGEPNTVKAKAVGACIAHEIRALITAGKDTP